MGRNALGGTKDKFVRIRVSDDAKERVKKLMGKLKYQGQEQDFLMYLVERGVELVEYEQTLLKGSAASYVASKKISASA